MTSHDAFLRLAAAALDFDLSPVDRHRLDAHLAQCMACARSAAAMRADARVLEGLPGLTLPERRAAEILAAAMQPARTSNPLRLIAVAAIIALLALGSLAVGAELLRRSEESRLVVLLPAPSTSPQPSPVEPTPSSEPGLVAGPETGTLAVTHDGVVEVVTLGGDRRQVAEGRDATWIREGQLAFTCPQGPERLAVCATDPESGDVFVLLEDADRPSADPDGRRVAMHRGMIDVGETWVAVLDSDVVGQLTSGDLRTWSPDGRWLLGQPESPTYEVAVVSADGGDARVVSGGSDAAWAPDSRRIVVVAMDGDVASLRAVDRASGADENIYEAQRGSSLEAPAWLASGAVVFAMDGDLWRLDPGASEAVALTSGLRVLEEPELSNLDVSPDGRWIAFSTGSGAGTRVGVASINGGWTMLDLGDGAVTQPRWRPVQGAADGAGEPPPDPTPACPGPATAPEPPIVVASVPDGSSVEGTLGSFTLTTCSTTRDDALAGGDPTTPLLAVRGQAITIEAPPGWRILRWEGFDQGVEDEGANVWSPVDLGPGVRHVVVPGIVRDADSVLTLTLLMQTDDGRVVGSLPYSFLIRVQP